MDTNDQHQTTADDDKASREAQPATDQLKAADRTGEQSRAAGDPETSPCGRGKNLFGQWAQNLRGGLRIAFLLRVETDRFCATPGALALLALTDFLANLAVSFLLVGRSGSFAYAAVTSFFFHLPLLLFFGFLAGRILSRPALVVILPVALVAAGIPIELCHSALERVAQIRQLVWLENYLYAPHYYRFFLWWAVASLVFLLRLQPARLARTAAVWLLFSLLVLLPLWFFPRGDLWLSAAESGESGELQLTDEVLTAQQRLLDEQLAGLLPGRKGVADLYFLGFAGDAGEDVFLKELMAARRLFEQRFGASGRTLLLANNPQTAATLPFATLDNLDRALSGLGQIMNRQEDVLFLYLTSHGSREHELAVSNPPLDLDSLTPERLRRMLKKSGVTWKVVVVSACYAGGFVEPLQDDHTLIITAADASHESFGCGFGEKFTWFGEAFLDDALRHTFSFTEAFEQARGTIQQWEKEQRETPSNPQLWVGSAMKQKLATLEKQLAK